MTATIQTMPRPRGVLSDEQKKCLEALRREVVESQADYRLAVVDYLIRKGVSFSEMSKFTGLSTNTLQRWKREAGQ